MRISELAFHLDGLFLSECGKVRNATGFELHKRGKEQREEKGLSVPGSGEVKLSNTSVGCNKALWTTMGRRIRHSW